MYTLFISDLHLNPQQPELTQVFIHFLQTTARKAEAVYVLGDLFEVWIGDDDSSELHSQVTKALRELSDTGVALYFMHGNRDFLIGAEFATASGCQLLADPTVINLYGETTLLMHGDLLCTHDQKYLTFRAWTHKPWLQRLFLALPLAIRRKLAQKLRQQSQSHVRTLMPPLMDATKQAIARYLNQYQATLLIHGHTHRPAIHLFQFKTFLAKRIVLSDWDERGNVLICYDNGQKDLMPLT